MLVWNPTISTTQHVPLHQQPPPSNIITPVCVGLTEIGVAGVQQVCQAWRASRGVTRSFILILVYDHRVSVFKLLDVYVMFVGETFNVDTFRYRCLDVEKPCCRSLILGIFPSRLHQPRQNLVSVILKYLIAIKVKFRAIGHLWKTF